MFWRKISIKNKAVLITGCDSGFGNRLAIRLNEIGFRVYATVLDEMSFGSQQLPLNCKHTDRMCVLEMDVTRENQIDRCFEFVTSDLRTNGGVLWSVINNAGILTYGHIEWGQFGEHFGRVFDVNLFGVIRVTRKFLPLIRQSKGRIVIVSSLGGRISSDNLSAYCMSKGAVITFADVLRREMRKFKVNVSTIEPTFFKTGVYGEQVPAFEHNWQTTNTGVQEVYGQQYFAEQLKLLERRRRLSRWSSRLDIVVDDMIDAVVSRNPNRCYQPVNIWPLKLVVIVLPLIPNWLIDWSTYMIDPTVPNYMRSNDQ
ncbi:retinol dehydrogenase 16-like [Oppia nitens]|uniref:retinol dehydrogenase 16-like n=1 Tax=Oppia nitens TaxID=1686743 RepID=UPI0023DCCC7F|nr:retinol dehydrogenase 16-like [Oppia nitens]